MRAGNLRHKIEIQKLSGELDDLGQEVSDWMQVMTAFASIEDRSGREGTPAGAIITNTITTDIRIRYREGILPEMRIIDVCPLSAGCSGRTFNILSIRDKDGRRRELTLEVQEMRVAV